MSDNQVATLSSSPRMVMEPDAAMQQLSFVSQRDQAARSAWQKFIDYCLVDWGARGVPDLDEDLRPPTPAAIQFAIEIAKKMLSEGALPPSRIIPNGEGGLIFERYIYPNEYIALEIFEDLQIKLRRYRDSKLIHTE